MERSKNVWSAAFAAAFFRDFKPSTDIIARFFEKSRPFLKKISIFFVLRVKTTVSAPTAYIPAIVKYLLSLSAIFAAALVEILFFPVYSMGKPHRNFDHRHTEKQTQQKAKDSFNNMDFILFLGQFVSQPVVCFLAGFAAGISIGIFIEQKHSKEARLMQSERFAREDRLRAEQEAREKQEKEEKAKRIREFALYAREYGLYHDENDLVRDIKGRFYCPDCFDEKRITNLPPSSNGYITCPECGFHFDRDSVE